MCLRTLGQCHCEEPYAGDEAIFVRKRDCFAEFILSAVEGLLRNKMPNSHPLDSSFRWNDENHMPVIPGKAAGRDPESRSLYFCLYAEHPALWRTRNDNIGVTLALTRSTVFPGCL